MRIHILGASGSGTTTLGLAVAERLAVPHFDSDDYFWEPTDPPFEITRPTRERQTMLAHDLRGLESWVLSGSLCGWGDFLIPRFQLVIFLYVPTEIRLARLHERELEDFGAAALAPGGRMHENHREFLDWAATYDEGDTTMRSLERHQEWLLQLRCPVLRFEGEMALADQLERVLDAVAEQESS